MYPIQKSVAAKNKILPGLSIGTAGQAVFRLAPHNRLVRITQPNLQVKTLISETALATRLDRFLSYRGAALRKCRRDSRWYAELGDYYIVDLGAGLVTQAQIDIEKLAREHDLMKAWEEVA